MSMQSRTVSRSAATERKASADRGAQQADGQTRQSFRPLGFNLSISSNEPPPVSQSLEIADEGTRGRGEPLSQKSRLQQSFGPYDLSSVRVHKDEAASSAAESLSASAYTRGENIALAGSASLRTLAHEAAHVVQQRQPGSLPAGVSTPGDQAEHHADAVADRVVAGQSAVDLLSRVAPLGQRAVSTSPPPVIQRRWQQQWWNVRNQKTDDGRVSDTIEWLAQYAKTLSGQPGQDCAKVAKELRNGMQAGSWDEHRVSMAMHMDYQFKKMDKGGTSEERQLRRAIILLRTVMLRNDVKKTKTEVRALAGSELGATLDAVIQKAAVRQVRPAKHELEYLRGEIEKNKRRYKQLTTDEERKHPEQLEGDARWFYDHMKAHTEAKVALEQASSIAPKRIFLPHPEMDEAVKNNKEYLGHPTIHAGEQGLDCFQAGGELYVLGHGNFGSGVGPHAENWYSRQRYMDEAQLVRALVAAGLPRQPDQPVDLYIWACWAATHTRRAFGMLGKRTPFIRRVAALLAAQGFENYRVTGYAGTVATSGLHQDVSVQNGQEKTGRDVGQDSNFSTYEVSNGDYNRTIGKDWTSKSTAADWQFWKNHIYTVRRRGGRDTDV